MAKVKVSISRLEKIIADAKEKIKRDSSLSECLEITVIEKSDSVSTSDALNVWIESSYAECQGVFVGDYKTR